jgi:hypothetical protein
MLIGLLLLILATMLAGPLGFALAANLLIAWAIFTGAIHLILDIVPLLFRILGALARSRS